MTDEQYQGIIARLDRIIDLLEQQRDGIVKASEYPDWLPVADEEGSLGSEFRNTTKSNSTPPRSGDWSENPKTMQEAWRIMRQKHDAPPPCPPEQYIFTSIWV